MPDSMDDVRKGRSAKSEALHALQSHSVRVQELLRPQNGPITGPYSRIDVWDILLAVPHLNRKGARRVCIESGAFPHKRLGELSDHERELLIAALPKRVTDSKPD